MRGRDLLEALAALPPHRLLLPVEVDLGGDGENVPLVDTVVDGLYEPAIVVKAHPSLLEDLLEQIARAQDDELEARQQLAEVRARVERQEATIRELRRATAHT